MYKRILVPVDGSPTSDQGLAEALRLARSTGARLRILHVVDGIAFARAHNPLTADAAAFRASGRKLLDEIVARLRKQPVKAEAVLVENLSGRAADSIVKEAKKWNADVIVMGTHGRRGINRVVFGSDAEIVLHTAPVPVLLVRGGTKAARPRRRAAARKRRSASRPV
jgi:nucleotide-binding universal stress UspA family protein